ncbi:hypothetical protein [Halococcus sp. PRR34]|uniref:hypothetical protein n=1 Tax=Halococcus sp. PRR34 TaxID=3020830 RepID=UPI002360D14C|nr:hypothetical protein [Halococcus sp. PRR34]
MADEIGRRYITVPAVMIDTISGRRYLAKSEQAEGLVTRTTWQSFGEALGQIR